MVGNSSAERVVLIEFVDMADVADLVELAEGGGLTDLVGPAVASE